MGLATFQFIVDSAFDPDGAASYLEDIVVDAEHLMGRHTKEWETENSVVIGFPTQSAVSAGEIITLTETLRWAAQKACLETFYHVELTEQHADGRGVSWTLRPEIQRHSL